MFPDNWEIHSGKKCLPRQNGKLEVCLPRQFGNVVFPDQLSSACYHPSKGLENWKTQSIGKLRGFQRIPPSRFSLRSFVLWIDIKAATHFAAFGRLDGHNRLVLVGIRHSRVVARQTRSLSLLRGIRHSFDGIFTSKVARLQGKAQ